MKPYLLACLFAVAITVPFHAADQPDGFLLGFELDGDTVELTSAMRIENYAEGFDRQGHRAPGRGAWTASLLDAGGDVLWSTRLQAPETFAPLPTAGEGVPFSLKVPDLAAATELVLHDSRGVESWRTTLDAAFRRSAAAARSRFLTLASEDSRRLEARNRRLENRAPIPYPYRPAERRFDQLPEELRAAIASQLGTELDLSSLDATRLKWLADRGWLAARKASVRKPMARPPRPEAKVIAPYKAGAFTLSGMVTDADTGMPLAGARFFFYQYDEDLMFVGYLGEQLTATDGSYSQSVDAGGVVVTLDDVPGGRYIRQSWFVEISGDLTLDIQALPEIVLSGRVIDPDGTGVGDVGLNFWNWDVDWSDYTTSADDGSYSVVVPRGVEIQARIFADPPYLQQTPGLGPFDDDAVVDLTLERGWTVTGTVRDQTGETLDSVTVRLRHLAETAAGESFDALADLDGTFRAVVPRDLQPPEYVLSFAASGYVRQTLGLRVESDRTVDLVMLPGVDVSGVVRSAGGSSILGAVVRAFRGQQFVTSYVTRGGGDFLFALEPGTYDFEVFHPLESLLPVSTTVTVEEPVERDFVLEPAAGNVSFRLSFPDSESHLLVGPTARFEVRRGGELVASYLDGSLELDPQTNRYFIRHTLYLPPGSFDVTVHLNGYGPMSFPGVEAGAGTLVRDLGQPVTWSGRLRAAGGGPLADTLVYSRDEVPSTYFWAWTDSQGRFEIPLTGGGFVKAHSPDDGATVAYTERLGATVANRTEDLVLEDLVLQDQQTAGGGGAMVELIYGDPEAERYTIAMIGDGYTDVIETFTDSNGNGIWDGVVYYDFDGNGIWDGEPKEVYGEAPYPEIGTDPTAGNEPFDDLNGDGFPNLDDQAVFDRQSVANLRALFGHDFFSQLRDLFNVYRIRVISNQAGHDVVDGGGQLAIERDTRFDTLLYSPSRGYLFSVDYSEVNAVVNEYVPQADTIMVLVNQPVRMGRANSFIMAYGGPNGSVVNNDVIAHEMGHNFGGLQDEYRELNAHYEQGESQSFVNVTTLSQRDEIPWRELIPASTPVPSVQHTPGAGLFEGALYHVGGIYRPAQDCLMGIGSQWFCPVCLRHLRQRVAAFSGGPAGPVVPGSPRGSIGTVRPAFTWGLLDDASHYELELRRLAGDLTVGTWTVYGSRFELDRDLDADAGYRWRLRPHAQATADQWSPWVEFSTSPGEVEDVLFLRQGRFRVEVSWRDFQGQTGSGQVVPVGSDDSGLFWFFGADNWEMLIKVLDGCGINGYYWVFAAATTDVEYTLTVTDTQSGTVKEYFNALGQAAAALTDSVAFQTCSASPASSQADSPRAAGRVVAARTGFGELIGPLDKATCGSGPHLCLNGGRFRVEVNWRDFEGQTGSAQVVPFGSDDSGLLWFFNAGNWEMLIKVLDGCAINDRFWVFSAATTNVEFTVTVTDTQTGQVEQYFNPLGLSARAVTDTDAFATCQ
ncbi:MAG: hypothetical protein GY719_16500 [bacterium]|nr:hypothetical protein [bacterium]